MSTTFVTSEIVSISKLKTNPRNARHHSKGQIKQLADCMRGFGFTAPLIVDEAYTILAGHGRYLAARDLGYTELPVRVMAGLSEAQKRAYAIADNKIALNAAWDHNKLVPELRDLAIALPTEGLDLTITGFAGAEFDGLLTKFVDDERAPPDTAPARQNVAITQLGDLWKLEGHRLVCADARDPKAFDRLFGDERAAMVFTDPPYNVPTRAIQGRGRIKHRDFVAGSGEMPPSEYAAFLRSALSALATRTRPGALIYTCIDWRQVNVLWPCGEELFGPPLNLIVWNKTNAGQGSHYRSQHELILLFISGDEPHQNNIKLGTYGRNRSNVWTYGGQNTFRRGRMKELALHPTCKPVPLVADAMRDSTQRGDIVLDAFMGSGTTIMAAEWCGRRGFGVELDPAYVDVAVRRWQEHTRVDAILVETGETFDEVAERRRP